MKQTIKLFALAVIAIIGISSCNKEDLNKTMEVKNISLEVTLQAGETYNLDLSPYGVQHATSGITQEAINVAGSKLTVASTNPFAANYQYTANSEITSDVAVLQVLEDDGSKGSGNHSGGHDGKIGKTDKCKQQHLNETNITIHFTIKEITH